MKGKSKGARRLLAVVCLAVAVWEPSAAFAQAQVGPADASRVDGRVRTPAIPMQRALQAPLRPQSEASNAPPGSEKIHLLLKQVVLEGEGADEALAAPAYQEFLGKEITLDKAWLIAARVAERYQAEGYFLTQVYVPAQEIGDGTLRLKVVAGFISEISLGGEAIGNNKLVEWADRLRNQKPLRLQEVESVLLRINSLPGFKYRTVLELPEAKNAPEGAVRLNIVGERDTPHGQIGIDNYGSRFLGPFEISQRLQMAIIPNQLTTISVMTATQIDELKYGSVTHEIPLNFRWNIDLSGSITSARPGYTLKSQEIASTSKSYGLGATYRWIHQRDQSLNVRTALEMRDTESKILGTIPLVDDAIRIARINIQYEGQGVANSYHQAGLTVSRGLPVLGASKQGAANLSRAQARPDFTKVEMTASHTQLLPMDFYAIGRLSAQYASAPLFSSEEFGYGGQSFGRAYDSSELTGDHGIAASIELRYGGLRAWQGTQLSPYAFYDIGKVWNRDIGQRDPISASSAGFGMRFSLLNGAGANLGAAFPLTRPIATPLDGHTQGPRYLLQLTQDF